MLSQRSRTPIPQALTYLIDDSRTAARRAARRRRVGLPALLTTRRCCGGCSPSGTWPRCELVQIAPTVAVSPVPTGRLLDVLRAAGFAPAAEAPDGGVLAHRCRRAARPVPTSTRLVVGRGAERESAQLGELVRRIRDGDALTELTRRIQPVAAASRRHLRDHDGVAALGDPCRTTGVAGHGRGRRVTSAPPDRADLDGRRVRPRSSARAPGSAVLPAAPAHRGTRRRRRRGRRGRRRPGVTCPVGDAAVVTRARRRRRRTRCLRGRQARAS